MRYAIVCIVLEARPQTPNAILRCQREEVRNVNEIAFGGIQHMVECPHHKVQFQIRNNTSSLSFQHTTHKTHTRYNYTPVLIHKYHNKTANAINQSQHQLPNTYFQSNINQLDDLWLTTNKQTLTLTLSTHAISDIANHIR